MRIPEPPLLLITDRKQARSGLVEIAEDAFAMGCRWLSVREKDLSTFEQIALVTEIKARARAWNARVTLHGVPADALAAKADGVHLRAGSAAEKARNMLGPDALIGLSVHKIEEVKNIDPNIVDYVILGPVFETISKPGYESTLGLDGFCMIAAVSSVPVIAIGGVDRDRGPLILKHGAVGLAVMGGVMRADDPADETRAILRAFQ